MFQITCHCGKIKLSTKESPQSITSCNCSICYRLGALWAYYDWDKVTVDIEAGLLSRYLWGEKTITYHRCDHCGCTTHYTTIKDDGKETIAINCRMADPAIIESTRIRKFDGIDRWEYLDE